MNIFHFSHSHDAALHFDGEHHVMLQNADEEIREEWIWAKFWIDAYAIYFIFPIPIMMQLTFWWPIMMQLADEEIREEWMHKKWIYFIVLIPITQIYILMVSNTSCCKIDEEIREEWIWAKFWIDA